MLIDTHCHLNSVEAYPDPEAELAFARENGVARLVVVGTHPPDWPRAVEMAERFDDIYAIVGWHPNYTADYDPASLPELRTWLGHPKVKGLGEIGLDYHWDYAPRDRQFRALHDQLSLAEELSLPVIFHAREAYSDLLTVLEARPRLPYLFHCFAGDLNEAARATALDAYFGVDGPITYKKSDDLRRVMAAVPRDRVVLETDAPYMAPTPFRGKPNRPAFVRYVAEGLAQCWETSTEETIRQTGENARRFFEID